MKKNVKLSETALYIINMLLLAIIGIVFAISLVAFIVYGR